jgi:hypothetical protein
MEWGRLLALLPLAFIVWWFYALLTTVIPCLNVAISETLSMTWLQIVGVILFFVLGIPVLIISFIFFILILCVD